MTVACPRCQKPVADGAKFCLNCGAMLEVQVQDATDKLIGQVLLGRYRVVRVLGEGGMGKVYLAEQKMGTAQRKVAIKTLHPELLSDPQLVGRFHRECETVIELSHPNTVQFYDFGELDDHTHFIVMEFIEGESLAAVLQRGAIDPARTDKILIQICGSLHEAHQRGIVHRDLKPENVLLTRRGGQEDFVKVLDFGIAKRGDAEDPSKAKLTKQGMVLGTPPYMSPEQFSGQALDARSDVYSLGIMTYEMLTGQLPFDAKTPWEWATKHLTAQPTPIDAHPQSAMIVDRKRRAIMRTLEKDRERRHPSVLDFLQDFTGYQDAQAAWTMATSAGGIVPRSDPGPAPVHSTSPTPSGRIPVGTPGPMPQANAWATPSPPSGHQQWSTPTPGGMQQPGPGYGVSPPMGVPMAQGYPSGSMPEVPRRGGSAGTIVAVLVVLLFVVGGGVGGGVWYLSQQGDDPQTNDPPPPVNPNNHLGQVVPPVTPVVPPVTPVAQLNPMIPTTPTVPPVQLNPIQPTTPVQPIQPTTPVQPTTPEDPPDAPDRPEGPGNEGSRFTAAEEARARSILNGAQGQLSSNNIDGAVAALQNAQRLVGRNHAAVRDFRRELGRRGSNRVGHFMLRGDCTGAQQLYRRLRSVGAEGDSRQHFSGDWCRP